MTWIKKIGLCLIAVGISAATVDANDWLRFRGPNGSGVIVGDAKMPVRWSPTQNIKWKTELPGPGVSCPIVVGNKVFVRCYSGYGVERNNPGDINNLKRHLVCVDAASGNILWNKTVDAVQPEDPYTGAGVPAHGYASSTPTSDGQNVYVFFGKTGALAFDLQGNQLWQTKLGTESDPRRWGSAASPILFEDLLIVTASSESQALVALDKNTGKEVWRQEAKGLDSLWGTPTLVETKEGTQELVVGVAGEIWGLNPKNGKLRWYCDAGESDQASISAVANDGIVYFMGGRDAGTIAVRTGGTGNVTDTHVVWTGRETGRFASPVVFEGEFYSIGNNIISHNDAKTGEPSGQARLSSTQGNSGGARRGGIDYASPIIANGKLYYLKGNGEMFVLDANDDLKQIAVNRLSNESESFASTPGVSDGSLFIRSDKNLYCVVSGPFDESAEPKPETAEENQQQDEGAGGQRGERGQRGGQGGERGQRGGQRFDPEEVFKRMDQDSDGKLTKEELAGPFQQRSDDWDKDKNGSISLTEFQEGIQSMQRQGGRGGAGGGRGGGRGEPQDTRPDRPQRPPFDNGITDDGQ
jgi:outer membrane protein assembly factor BamB